MRDLYPVRTAAAAAAAAAHTDGGGAYHRVYQITCLVAVPGFLQGG